MTEQRSRTDSIPQEFDGLVAGFRRLLEKYPEAAGQFSLAYHPAGVGEEPGGETTAGIPHPEFDCREIEPGFVVCERVHKQ